MAQKTKASSESVGRAADSGHPAQSRRREVTPPNELEASLAELAPCLPATARFSAESVHERVTHLVVLLAGHELACSSDDLNARQATDSLAALVRRAQSLDAPWWEGDALTRGLDALADCPAPAHVARALQSSVARAVRPARREPARVAECLGGLHERLLSLKFERLEGSALQLRSRSEWLQPGHVLARAPAGRCEFLQRTLGLSKRSVSGLSGALRSASCEADVEVALSPLWTRPQKRQGAGTWVLQPGLKRRRQGAHYTPAGLCQSVVERTLAPLVERLPKPRAQALLELRICDPAMGAGAFLLAAAEFLARALWLARRSEGAGPEGTLADARRAICERVLWGVDEDPVATSLARLSLRHFCGDSEREGLDFRTRLRCGNALVGRVSEEFEEPDAHELAPPHPRRFDWCNEFVDVFSRERSGFDAVIGNPPWVAFVGRARQPMDAALARYFAATNPAFRQYRTLHGLFAFRCASLLRGGGRLGLVLPTSVADLAGYRATRDAHDLLSQPDDDLPSWGDGAFPGVFQPSMALLSTRRRAGTKAGGRGRTSWSLARNDLGSVERALLERLAALPKLPAELFGERGFQTTRDDHAHLRRLPGPTAPFDVALREGADICEFFAGPPTLFADPGPLGRRLRTPEQWQRVALLVRQTARYPIAAPADGAAFRNSILACFENQRWPRALLLGLLNSSLFRWLHFWLHRDAREGMPQLKVGHLRALPQPISSNEHTLAAIARAAGQCQRALIGHGGSGQPLLAREKLDARVAQSFQLTSRERAAVAEWAFEHPPPLSRRVTPNRATAIRSSRGQESSPRPDAE